jgi:hypothetical protein
MSNQEPQHKEKTMEEGVEKRRRFIKGAGIAAPVIMALANRPAFGAVCTVSGFISVDPGNVSAQGHVVSVCGGRSPGKYKNPYNGSGSWPSGYNPGGPTSAVNPEGYQKRPTPAGTLMKEGFGYDGLLKDMTMYDVLWVNGATDPNQLYAHLVAALFNALNGLYVNGLTETEIKDMYQQMSTAGTYQAAPGVSWNAITLVGFLTQTMV